MNGGVVGLINTPIRTTLTILTSNWQFNNQTNLYEYTVNDGTVLEKHYIEILMDIENQNKLVDGQVNSFNGGFTIATSNLPDDTITITVIKTLTREVGE